MNALVVSPDQSFAELARALAGLGWKRDLAVAAVTPRILADEPELAGWRYDAIKTRHA